MVNGNHEVTPEVKDRVAVLTLSRPDIRNVSHETMIAEIERACAHVNRERSISCLIITAVGTVFSAGGNVRDMAVVCLVALPPRCSGAIGTGFSEFRGRWMRWRYLRSVR